nr:hypothetical protein [Tanacetum cinerariifolium]
MQNFEIQFLKEAAKFVGDFKSLAKEADASLAKQKILELEIERLLKAVVSQDIISVVQNASVVDTSDLQTELESYKDMQQKIERLQAQLGALKGKSNDTSCVSNTLNPLSQKLENENVELEFQVLNYARENAHLKATYKNLFDSISVSRVQTETKIASLQNELQSNIYKNAKLRMQLFKKVSDQKDNTQDSSKNTKFAKQSNVETLPKIGKTNALSKPVTSNSVSTPQVSKGVNNAKVIAPGMFRISPDKLFKKVSDQKDNTLDTSENTKFAKKPIVETLPKVGKSNALSNPVTSNSVSTPQESKGVNNDKVIAPGMFRINPDKTSREAKKVPNTVRASGIDNTKTRRPQPRSNTKNDRVPSASKSSRSQNKEAEVEENFRNLLLSKNNKHISSACNNIKIDSQD